MCGFGWLQALGTAEAWLERDVPMGERGACNFHGAEKEAFDGSLQELKAYRTAVWDERIESRLSDYKVRG
jgi:hypothetical protein